MESANFVHENSDGVKELIPTQEQLGKLNNYTELLLKSQKLLDDSWNKTKELVQNSLTANQLPAANIFQPARQKIKMDVASFAREDAENCIQHTEDQFNLLYSEIAESMLNCVSSKSRKVLISLNELQDALQDGICRINAIKKKIILCQNETETEQSLCQQMQLTDAQNEEDTGVKLISQVNEALTAAEALPGRLMDCSKHILKYLRGQVPTIVASTQDCKK